MRSGISGEDMLRIKSAAFGVGSALLAWPACPAVITRVRVMEAFDTAQRNQQLEESVRRLPGPAYYRVLKWVHDFLRPANYVEIGVNRGVSLDQARRDTPHLIGIDPSPNLI